MLHEELKQWLKKEKSLFISGDWVDGESTFQTINPATEDLLSNVYVAGSKEVNDAVLSARKTFQKGGWSRMSLAERSKRLRKIGDLIEKNRETLAILESLDTGKPITESLQGDIPRARDNFYFFADFALSEEPQIYFHKPPYTHCAEREGVGVSALIVPWNLPLYLATWKLAPCLMMGNSALLKPSELTPLTASFLAEIFLECDFPPGVFQLLHGFGENSTGEFLVSHPGIDAISFTGETRTGQAIMKSASPHLTRTSFEMGGKGASVVFEDADIDRVVSESIRSSFRNQGEICLSMPRLFVQENIFEKFANAFVSRISQLIVGDPLDSKTQMGSLISHEHYKKVLSYVEMARPNIICGGKRPESLAKGYFIKPTVISGLDSKHSINQEEIFGPVVSLIPFESESQLIEMVNNTSYGLASCIWTSNKERAIRVSKAIRTGLVWINCWFVRDLRVPFGGMKKSGVGREGGKFSLDFFSEWKSVCTYDDTFNSNS